MFELVKVSTLIFLLDSISLGPAVAAVVARSVTTGLARTTLFVMGLVVGVLILFVMAVLGLAARARSPSF